MIIVMMMMILMMVVVMMIMMIMMIKIYQTVNILYIKCRYVWNYN